ASELSSPVMVAQMGVTDNTDGTFTIDSVEAGGSFAFEVRATIASDFMGEEIINNAEITGGSTTIGGANAMDEDSTPGDNASDPAELDNDNVIVDMDDGAEQDNDSFEDDYDPARVTIEQIFDLALIKIKTPGTTISQRGKIQFDIIVYNQGTIDAFDVEITDYLDPATSWVSSTNGMVTSGGGTATMVTDNGNATFQIDRLNAGDSIVITTTVQVERFFTQLINRAEISRADNDQNPSNTPPVDIDSSPDNINFNQTGEENALVDDNVIDENGKNGGDEDDHDYAVFDMTLVDPMGDVYCTRSGEVVTGGTISVEPAANVIIFQDGSTGRYQWVTDGTPGIYTMTYTPPAGYELSTICLPQSGNFDPTGLEGTASDRDTLELNDGIIFLGLGIDGGGTMTNFDCNENPYYYTFDLAVDDPLIHRNNLAVDCGCVINQTGDDLGGRVFSDSDNDGSSAGDPGQPGVLVKVYECDNPTPVCETTTNALGDWVCEDLPNGEYRVEFSLPDDGSLDYLQGSVAGVDNGTAVQFVNLDGSGVCGIDYGVLNPADYCDPNPEVAFACFVANGAGATSLSLLSQPDNTATPFMAISLTDDSNDWGTPRGTPAEMGVSDADAQSNYPVVTNNIATSGEVGTAFGVAWDNSNSQIFSGSFVRAFTSPPSNASVNGFGEGVIHSTSLDGATAGTPAVWLDLEALLGDGIAGDFNSDGVPPTVPPVTNYGRTGDFPQQVGYTGLGSIRLNNANTEMYVVNLATREVLVIPIGADGSAPTSAAEIKRFPLPTTECGGNWPDGRPYGSVLGLGVHPATGRVYATLTCTGPTLAEMNGYVYSFDPADTNPTAGSFQLELTVPLNVPIPASNPLPIFFAGNQAYYAQVVHPWEEVEPDSIFYPNDPFVSGGPLTEHQHNQPWLGEIAFDPAADGTYHMTLATRNRYHDLINASRYAAGGVLYRACNTGSNFSPAWSIEQDGNCLPFRSTVNYTTDDPTRAGGNTGVNNRFYKYIGREGAMMSGSVTYHPATGEIIAPTIDNVFNNATSGIAWFDPRTGERTRDTRLLGDFTDVGNDAQFEKANNWGGITLACNPPDIQVGSYVWEDIDMDGVQDACEMPIPDLIVKLYDNDGDLVGQDTTGAQGEYYFDNTNVDTSGITVDGAGIATPMTVFSGLEIGEKYFIVFMGDSYDDTEDEITVGGTMYTLTTADNGEGNNPDFNDSDASEMTVPGGIGDMPVIMFVADSTDHSFDVGLVEPISIFDLALTKVINDVATPAPYAPDSTVQFTITVTNQGTEKTYDVDVADYFNTAELSTPLMVAQMGVTNNNDGTFTIDSVEAGGTFAFEVRATIASDFMGDEIINNAEITGGAITIGGADAMDEDSTPGDNDGDPAELDNDDVIVDNDDGAEQDNDPFEDDYDPARVPVNQIFDLALIKEINTTETPGPFMPGDVVRFTITVTNQGSLDAYDVDVEDYFLFSELSVPTLVAQMGVSDNGGGQFTIDSVEAGQSYSFDVTATINPSFTGTSIINNAEITGGSTTIGGTDTPDEDSTPANNNGDPAETGNDDVIVDNDDGSPQDDDLFEDDYDPAEVMVGQVFDLALIKQLNTTETPGPFRPGDAVRYMIIVTNQGTLDAFDVDVADYFSASELTTPTLVAQAGVSDNTGGTFTIDEIPAGERFSFDVETTIDINYTGTNIINNAEITGGATTDNGPDAMDEDSTPGDNDGDPAETDNDDVITDNDDGSSQDDDPEEDDYDPAETPVEQIFDLALTKVVNMMATPGPFAGDSTVQFTITVTNQGTLKAYDIDVADYFNASELSAPALIAQMGVTDNNDGTFTIDSVEAGSSFAFEVRATIASDFMGDEIINNAEITGGSITIGGSDAIDEDSTPGDNAVDPAELDNDDVIVDNDDGAEQDNDPFEDDYDPARFPVNQIFDLALTKSLNTAAFVGPYAPGDSVQFTIAVTNQGSLDAFDVDIADYFQFSELSAPILVPMAGVSDNGGGRYTIDQIDAGQVFSFEVKARINPSFGGISIINNAEITGGSTVDNGPDVADEDSTPADDSTSNPETGNDDVITDNDDGSPQDDDPFEDDFDPAEVMVDNSCVLPTSAQLMPVASACDIATELDNGAIIFNGVLNGTHYAVSTANPAGGIYDGPIGIGSATLLPTTGMELLSGIDHAGASYVIRIYNTESDCFDDFTVNVPAGPDCEAIIEILDPCQCFDVEYDLPAVDPFEYLDSIKVTAVPGEIWRVYDYVGIEQVDSFVNRPFPLDTVLTEIMPGMYTMNFAHTANVGYTIFVTNTPAGSPIGTPGDSLSIGATCFQPEPGTIDLPLDVPVCPKDSVPLVGFAMLNGMDLPGGSFNYDIILGSNPGDTLFNRTGISADEFSNGQTVAILGRYIPPAPADPNTNGGAGFCDQTFYQEITFADTACIIYDLALTKSVNLTATPGPFGPDSTVQFTITITNQGTVNAYDVDVADYHDSNELIGMSLVSQMGVTDQSGGMFTIDSVEAGQTFSFEVNATINSSFPGTSITNNAEITGGSTTIGGADATDEDSTPGDNSTSAPETGNDNVITDIDDGSLQDNDPFEDDYDPAQITVVQPSEADLSLLKTVSNARPSVGDVVTYSITIRNAGPIDATGVAVVDTVPNGFTGIDNISNGGIVMGKVIDWSGLSIVNGGELTLTFTVEVLMPGPGINYDNVAQVTASDQDDPDSTPNNGVDQDGDGKVGTADNNPNDGSVDNDGDDDEDNEPVVPQIPGEDCGCQDNIIVTLNNDPDCNFVLDINNVQAGTCPSTYAVLVDDGIANGDTIDLAGTFNYVIYDTVTGDVNCWGTVTAEDKTAPILAAPANDTLECWLVDEVLNNAGTITGVNDGNTRNDLGTPSIDDCSDVLPFTWADIVEYGDCEDDYFAKITRRFTVEDIHGNRSTAEQVIVFESIPVDSFAFEADTNPNDGDGTFIFDGTQWVLTLQDCSADSDDPAANRYPVYIDKFGNKVSLDDAGCGLTTQTTGFLFDGVCGDGSYKDQRTIEVFDWCEGGSTQAFSYLVKVGDFAAPVFDECALDDREFGILTGGASYSDFTLSVPDAITTGLNNAGADRNTIMNAVDTRNNTPAVPMVCIKEVSTGPMDCTASINTSLASLRAMFGDDIVTDCEDPEITVEVISYVDEEIGKVPTGNKIWEIGAYTRQGQMLVGLPVGFHALVISATDGCYNAATGVVFFDVEDLTKPVMKCDDELRIILVDGDAKLGINGYALASAEDVDEGSWDNCALVDLHVRRAVDNASGAADDYEAKYGTDYREDYIEETGYSRWDDIVEFFCADIDVPVEVQ
ncbi:MAG: SdrD B-like domain-containing protein, partial [Bacteroidota bacterium]